MSKNRFATDWQQLFQQFSATNTGNYDLSKFVNTLQQNFDTIGQMNKMLVSCTQALADCQRDAVQRSLQNLSLAVESIVEPTPAELKTKKSVALLQEAMQHSTLSAREAAQILTRSNREMFELLSARMQESVSDLQSNLGQTARRTAGKR